MIYKMFTVYDCKAEAYMAVFQMPSIGQATRAFGDTCNDESHAFYLHPEDYTLFYLGEWNDTNASFSPTTTPQALGVAIEYKMSSSRAPLEPANAGSKSNSSSLSAEQ